jgi:ribose transport system substrate-binding protein
MVDNITYSESRRRAVVMKEENMGVASMVVGRTFSWAAQKHVVLATLLGALLLAPIAASAKDDMRMQMRAAFDSKLVGKKIVWVPIYLGVLESELTNSMRSNFKQWGIDFKTRDPNFNADLQLQTITAAINEHPDVLIVQNPSTTLLVSEIKRAMESGIHVIQVSMGSNIQSDAFVGDDWRAIGREMGREIVAQCGPETSGKVALIGGEATAAGSLDQLNGALEVFAKNPHIQVVSNQPANWDAGQANRITSTVLQQHPDLCAVWGVWGTMMLGAAEAVRNANLQGKVKVFASSEGQQADCDAVQSGLFTATINFRGNIQGDALAYMAATLLQMGDKPGVDPMYMYTDYVWVRGKEDEKYCFVPTPAKGD